MDAFEAIIAQLLEDDKYWVRKCVKVNLTKTDKVLLSKPSMPRPEIDIVAYDVISNTLLVLEVKSFLDSPGVYLEHVKIKNDIQQGRYKILTSTKYQTIVAKQLVEDLREHGHIYSEPQIKFGLIAGNIHKKSEEDFIKYFAEQNWFFWGPTLIKEKLKLLASKGYEDNAVTIVAKLLVR